MLSLIPHIGTKAEDSLYLQSIKPVLKARCYACHGGLKQESDLRLDTADSIFDAGIIDSGALLQRITSTDLDVRMPPEGEPLEPSQIAAIKKWIDSGSPKPVNEVGDTDPSSHWAFQPVTRPHLPKSKRDNPIDALLDIRRSAAGITPLGQADKLTLIRRLYLDLVGMPPSIDELNALMTNSSNHWYTDTIEKLLNDPRHGERWGRHWMDIWRYSDWWGLGAQLRFSQKHIWHWRDWIIESLNDDLPYDEMVRQMLAADELYPNDLDKLRGSGYLARNWQLFNRNHWMEDVVEHVGKGFLGLTFNCAKCHDHKFDPIAQTDYYNFRAFFEPYHVRTDVLPGVRDVAVNGLPRPFDGLPDAKTFLFTRGNEKTPDKSIDITPGVPDLLGLPLPEIQAVSLPDNAWQPERRKWVFDAHLQAAEDAVSTAEANLKAATQKLDKAEALLLKFTNTPDQTPPEKEADEYSLEENFEQLEPKRWKIFGGEWEHNPGRLDQKMDGATRSVLRLLDTPPADFEATLRLTINGGSMWRSVGIEFDSTQVDPSQDITGDHSTQNVYMSGYAREPKVHAAFNKGGTWQYPRGAMGPIQFELGKEYVLKVQVRDTLINAYLDDELIVSWYTQLARRPGSIQISTFDVLPTLKAFTLRALPEHLELVKPENNPIADATSMAGAKAALATAKQNHSLMALDLEIAKAAYSSVKARGKALQSMWNNEDEELVTTTRNTAIRAQQQTAVLASRRLLMQVESKLASGAGKKEELEKQLADAKTDLESALKAKESPIPDDANVESFVGAVWTPTRFYNSSKDDEKVEFHAISTGRRTALAKWITDKKNPLTARVAVNHIWLRHMGEPLVKTVFDFGRRGNNPAQPELLDWLAAEFMDSGWSMRHLHRLIVTSNAYQTTSSLRDSDSQQNVDSENALWWRRPPIRVESQVVRDSILSISGTLDLTMGGPPVEPGMQAASTRRSVYFFHSNNSRNLFLETFDEALVKECYMRDQSIKPQQALAISNSQLVNDAAPKIAELLSKETKDNPTFIKDAFAVVLGISVTPDEIIECLSALEQWERLPEGTSGTARSQLIWVLLNHNDFVTIR